MKSNVRAAAALSAVLIGACGSSTEETSGPFCDGPGLATALSKAAPGETVRVGACRVTGSFTVRAGVHLSGAARGQSVIVASGGPGVVVSPAAGASSSVADLSIESDGVAGITAIGQGEVVVERVDVTATKGIGIGAEGNSTLTINDAKLTGPVNAGNAATLPAEATPKDTATHGIVVVRVADARLSNVTVTGFGDFGALFDQSTVSWQGGSASANRGTGVMVQGGKATLESLKLCGTLGGSHKLPPYAGVFSQKAAITSRRLEVCDNAGVGLLHTDSPGVHVELTATNNAGPAVWTQQSDSLTITGTEIKNNAYAGLVCIETKAVTVKDMKFTTNVNGKKPVGSTGADELGDGVQLVRCQFGIKFENVTFTNNARTGIQLELGAVDEENADLTWTNVVVQSTGAQYGALCQGDLEAWGPTDKWSTGIVRQGSAVTNDATVTEKKLTYAGVIGPPFVPAPAAGVAALTR